jgi:YbbR domain-containing protein
VTLPSARDAATWLVAFGVAMGLWLFVNMGERTSERTLRARLDLERLPAGMLITSPVPEYVELRVVGSGLILSSIETTSLRAVLDLAGARPGTATYALVSKDFHLPRKLRVTRVSPSHVTLQFDRVSRRSVPIRVQSRGDAREGLKLANVQVQPEQVVVSGPRERISSIRQIDTRPIDLADLGAGETEIEAALESPAPMVQLGSTSARLRFVVEPVRGERVLMDVPVEPRGEGADNWRVLPPAIELTVRGPQTEITRLNLPQGVVWVDVRGLDEKDGGEAEPQFQLPPGIEAVRWKPKRVKLTPLPPAADTEGDARKGQPAKTSRSGE